MMELMFNLIFLRKKLSIPKLLQYGFQCEGDRFIFDTEILEGEFVLSLTFDEKGQVDTNLIEKETGETYVVYKTSSQGAFVGEVRTAISEVLEDIAVKCFEPSIFKETQTLQLIDYISSEYGDALEFLWEKLPECAIWRRKDTKKWYATVMTLEKRKLGIPSDGKVEIIDLRARPERIEELLQREGFYPGWHMNKKHWFTLIMDGSVSNEEVYQLVEQSYALATK